MAITDVALRNAKPRDKPYRLTDGGGLFLLINPNGARLWRLKTRLHRKDKLVALGAYPVVGLAAAREHALNAKRLIAEGKDPVVEKRNKIPKTERTFEFIARLWHEDKKSALDPAHAQRVLSRLERDVFPEIGARQIRKIEAADVLAIVRKIESRGALDISRRAKQCIGQIFRFAVVNGWASHDPTPSVNGLMKPKPPVQHMPKVPLKELPAFLLKLNAYDGETPHRRIITKQAIKLVLLTWVRSKELRFAERTEFEDIGGTRPLWRIPAHRMKMKREHLVPLSSQAADIVHERLQSGSTSKYLFPGEKWGKPLSENTMIFALYRMGYIGRQTVHGLRGIASTWGNESLVPDGNPLRPVRRFDKDWVEMQLAHAEKDDSRGAYNAAEYIVPRRQMMQDWSDMISAMEAGSWDEPEHLG